ncbi:hypothetical protein P3T37_004548 [Kitasatospora sp. MAA4]|uniref:hypothetical protein n=1 Tax=Kitasatospora sp. MAA4 TaxID=3035093 RepID=UPI002473AE6B|nr:hypothetical protein [Kitasatospora sp. MAA4]MDH6135138.1 hypothetical protein [Kitasatospora sp. MAA4]
MERYRVFPYPPDPDLMVNLEGNVRQTSRKRGQVLGAIDQPDMVVKLFKELEGRVANGAQYVKLDPRGLEVALAEDAQGNSVESGFPPLPVERWGWHARPEA